MKDTTREFLKVIFDPEDNVAWGKDDKSACKPRNPWASFGNKQDDVKFCINPLHTWRNGQNTTAINSLLFEVDDDIAIRDQIRLFEDSGLPYSTMVYSGKKSIHVIVRLTEPVEEKWFRPTWKAIAKALEIKGLPVDPATMKIPQLSRIPGAIRDNGKEQKRIFVKSRVDINDVKSWLETMDILIELPPEKIMKPYNPNANANIKDSEKFEVAYKMYKKSYGDYDPTLESGNHVNLFNIASTCYKVDLDLSATIAIANQEFGIGFKSRGKTKDTSEPITLGWKWAEKNGVDKIQLMSKEEFKEQQRLKRHSDNLEEQQSEVNQWLEDTEADVALNAGGTGEYIRVGTKYFNRAEGKLELWNESTLKADFGPGIIREFPRDHKYLKFVNKIDYLKPITRIGRNYNLFTKPDWNPTPGEFPTTTTLLRRVFGECGENQLEEGYDYIQLAITNPKQLLHALVLTSTERETGKDTFMEWLQFLLGLENVYIGMIDEFLDGFNGSFCSKHFICLNEVKISGMNKAAIQKLKTWTTQKTVNRNEKNQAIQTIDYWGRLVLATNFADDFMNIDDEENRFWIRTMPYLDKKGKDFDPNFMDKLKAEVPHFLHFILNRKLKHQEKQGRFWLPTDITNTTGLRRVQKNNKSNMYYEIQEVLENVINNTKDDAIYFTTSGLRELLPKDNDNNIKYIKKVLEGEFKLEQKKRLRTNSLSSFDREPKNCMYWEVTRADWEAQNTTEIEVDLPY